MRLVALFTVVSIVAAMTARPACAVLCQRGADRLTAAGTRPAADHCARMAHRRPNDPAAARLATADPHPCGDHARLVVDDARLPRLDAAGALPPLGAAAVVRAPLSPVPLAARRSGLAPPGPVRSLLVLRV